MSQRHAISKPELLGVAFLTIVFILITLSLNTTPVNETWLVDDWKSPVDVDNAVQLEEEEAVRVVCLGDTHSHHESVKVPDGDVLLYSGDMTDPYSKVPNEEQVKLFLKWLAKQPHKHKVVVAGNHDPEGMDLERLASLVSPVATYLQDSMAELPVRDAVLKVWGTPWQPQYPGTETFVPEPSEDLSEKWAAIPQGVHVVLSHSPPFLHHDRDPRGTHIGSAGLLSALEYKVKPMLSCFGHIHVSHGRSYAEGIAWANAAICNDDLEPVNNPISFLLRVPVTKSKTIDP